MVSGRVVSRKRDGTGIPIGLRHNNPILDTREYEVEFPDGSIDVFSATVIAENLYQQVDPETQEHAMFKGIIDHRRKGEDTGGAGISTKGWEMCVEWTDGTTTWLPLKDLRDSNPIETAEYALSRDIINEKSFSWWAPKALRKRDSCLSKVKTRYWKRTHKFGIEMPKSVKDALTLDAQAGTTLWRDAIAKEMKNVMPAFKFRDDDVIPPGYTKIDCHMVFDIKADLTRKARLVAGGHQTEVPKESVYSSVVSRDSVRLALMLATLNGLSVLSADVQNAYLNAPTKEKCYCIAGPEFGQDKVGRPVLIVRALYGLRSSGARWRDHLAETIRTLGFRACLADPDVWMRPAVKPDGTKYWEYVLVYVDDLLAVSHDPATIMEQLGEHYTLKPGSVRPPAEYLGSDIKEFVIPPVNGEEPEPCWSMSADTYVKRAVADVVRTLDEVGQRLKTRVTTPMDSGYRP
jgi:Reverse transcriptase (RNA-dependent DNA polymerase)